MTTFDEISRCQNANRLFHGARARMSLINYQSHKAVYGAGHIYSIAARSAFRAHMKSRREHEFFGAQKEEFSNG